jgi:site-specific recombinase XerD
MQSQTTLKVAGREGSDWLIKVPAGNWNLINLIKKLPDRTWDNNRKLWQVPDGQEVRYFLAGYGLIARASVDLAAASTATTVTDTSAATPLPFQPELDAIEEQLILRRYSYATRKHYIGHFRQFLLHFSDVHPSDVSKHQIEHYIVQLVRQRNISISTQNQIINAIKFYYEKVLGLPRHYYQLVRPKKEHHQPNVLSIAEVSRILAKTPNLKHRCALTLAYSSGLRISEVVNLRVADINFERRTLFIYDSKGRKDRYVVLSDEARQLLQTYLDQYAPKYWLFEGPHGEQYSPRSLQAVFHRSKQAANANPYATFHSLRHSFATHCIQAGYSTAVVKELLGHNSIKTTERYLHVAQHTLENFRSPLDLWQKEGNFEPPT